jgi:predicted O-methyltransferase YrrM
MNYEIPGWMSKRDLDILSYLSSCVPAHGNILEVGPFLGRSTSAILTGKHDTVSLDVVDTFTGVPIDSEQLDIEGSKEIFQDMRMIAKETGDWEQAFRTCQNDQIEKINVFKCSSKEFKIENQYDFCFIDANHSFEDVFFEIKKFSNIKSLIAGDDYNSQWPGVIGAVNKFRKESFTTLVVPRGSKIWMLVPISKYWTSCIKEII